MDLSPKKPELAGGVYEQPYDRDQENAHTVDAVDGEPRSGRIVVKQHHTAFFYENDILIEKMVAIVCPDGQLREEGNGEQADGPGRCDPPRPAVSDNENQ